ncbi:MAG TPA: hypothetical protein DET40_25105 [Lentisphaeria bacterium]|nr:MAG: hypothetical protein A2X45_18855 [Lentisphaerae bacterium GWF2_50_93]HCE46839.1 hypothetical protein [Lentisphaeria bacterium]
MNEVFKWIPLSFFLSLLFTLHAWGDTRKQQEVSSAKIRPEETISSEGIRLRVFKDATPRPLPALSATSYRRSKAGEKTELYKAHDLWLHDQYVASWGCDDGFITAYKMTMPSPPSETRSSKRPNMTNGSWR